MSTSLIIWKFVFLVVWNGIPIMDDAFLTRTTLLSSFSSSTLIALSHAYVPGKTRMYQIVCTGIFKPSESLFESNYKGMDISIMFGVLVYVGFLIPVSIQKMKIRNNILKPTFNKRKVDSLASHAATVFILTLLAFGGAANFLSNKYVF